LGELIRQSETTVFWQQSMSMPSRLVSTVRPWIVHFVAAGDEDAEVSAVENGDILGSAHGGRA
jgi:hypothetical protein